MNAGSLKASDRLKATLRALEEGGELSTLQIAQRTFSVAVHSDIAALRANGIQIPPPRREGRVRYYRLADVPPKTDTAARVG